MINEIEFKNKIVLITGGASGIGFLSGSCFSKLGATVVLLDINPDSLNEKVLQIIADGGKAIGITVDIRDYNQIINARDQIILKYGSIDIVINCAGGSSMRIWNCTKEFKDVPIEVYDWGLDVNLKGPFYINHAVMKQMVAQKSGVIINIGSITGEEGCPSAVDYSTAKSGVMYGMTKSLALYGAKYNIRVCCVSPGPVLTRSTMADMKTLLGRAAEPQEIVDLIIYLASDKAKFITGTNYLIDGGRNIMRVKE